jgi:radical SAM-linked protein
MKARIKFQKYGSMKFVGHLDVMRYFQKVFRRANIDNEYSKGFSPHQIMSFAAPLGVGLTSDGEYLDVQLLSADTPEAMIDRINASMTEGFRIIGYRPLLDTEPNTKMVTAMALVSSADYLVSLKDGYEISADINSKKSFAETFTRFMQSEEIVIGKKTKKSEKDVDIKPMITLVAFEEEDYEIKRRNTLEDHLKTAEAQSSDGKPVSMADVYENGIKVYLQLDTGSSSNLKPELVMEAFCEFLDVTYNPYAWQSHRIEVYTRNPETGMLAGLDQVDR